MAQGHNVVNAFSRLVGNGVSFAILHAGEAPLVIPSAHRQIELAANWRFSASYRAVTPPVLNLSLWPVYLAAKPLYLPNREEDLGPPFGRPARIGH
jgi:hypothetical protein